MPAHKVIDRPTHLRIEAVMEDDIAAVGDVWQHPFRITLGALIGVIAVNQYQIERFPRCVGNLLEDWPGSILEIAWPYVRSCSSSLG